MLGTILISLLGTVGLAMAEGKIMPDLLPQGRFVYEANCVMCHGKNGDGTGEMALDIVPKPRDFRRGIFKFRSTPSGTLPTSEDLMRTVRSGVAGTAMPTFAHLADRDIRAVVEYIKTFSNRWRKERPPEKGVNIPPQPEWFSEPEKLTSHTARGKLLYEGLCVSCHAEDGAGKVETRFEDSWGREIMPPDFRSGSIKSGKERKDYFRVLATGLDGTPMASFDQVLTEEQKWELVAYLEKLRKH